MNIKIILCAKLRRDWALSRVNEYRKRLASRICLELLEWDNRAFLKQERLFSSLKDGDRVVALDKGGKEFSSISFAEHIGSMLTICRNLYLFIGEAAGHSDIVLKNASEKWSLSKMTMSYEIALVALAEQLYRSMTILSGHPYHK